MTASSSIQVAARSAILTALLSILSPVGVRAMAPPLTGRVPDALASASEAGIFRLDPRPTGLTTQGASGTWRIPVILVSFADDTLRYPASRFEQMIFDTTHSMPFGSVAEYYTWASGGRLKLAGRVVASVRLPETSAFYADGNAGLLWYSTPRNDLGFARDALGRCQASVRWQDFDQNFDGYVDMVWFVHAGVGAEGGNLDKLWSITTRMTAGWRTQDGPYITTVGFPGAPGNYMLIDRFSMLPELSLFIPGAMTEIGVFAHEFGHALGLPDLYDVQNPANSGPGCWSLMSTGAYGGNGHTPEIPVDLGAWPRRYLGWDRTLRPTSDTTVTLPPIGQTHDIVDVWFEGKDSQEHYLVETRTRTGYDRNLPGEGLIVYRINEWAMAMGLANNRVNTGGSAGLAIVEGDADDDLLRGRNRGDGNDPLPGDLGISRFDDFSTPSAKSSGGGHTNVGLEDITPIPSGVRFRARVRAAGWDDPEDHTGPSYFPVAVRTPAQASGRGPDGVDYVVATTSVNGRLQIALRSSLAWDAPIVLSSSTGAAINPSLAVLPDGDLAVVWSDTRRGRSDIYYRSRIRDSWTPERRIVSMRGDCRSPSIANDGRGGLYLAFQYLIGDTLRVMFERMNYVFPIGLPVTVSPADIHPDNPLVVVDADGRGYLLCQDRGADGAIWFARVSPDSAMRPLQPLSTGPASSYAAMLGPESTLNVVWHASSADFNLLRYQRRSPGTIPFETTLSTLPRPIEGLVLATDDGGSVHLAYGINGPTGPSLRYLRSWPDGGWDIASTDLSYPNGYPGQQPTLLPGRDGTILLAYTGDRAGEPRFMIRRRAALPAPVLSSMPAAGPVGAAPARIGTNPTRAGRSIVVEGVAAGRDAPALLDVFDVGGRRIASFPIGVRDATWRSDIPGGTTAQWTSGIYFVRPRESRTPAARLVIVR